MGGSEVQVVAAARRGGRAGRLSLLAGYPEGAHVIASDKKASRNGRFTASVRYEL